MTSNYTLVQQWVVQLVTLERMTGLASAKWEPTMALALEPLTVLTLAQLSESALALTLERAMDSKSEPTLGLNSVRRYKQ